MSVTDTTGAPLTLMVVHAHPDDECLGTGGLLARSAAEGVRTVLVTATGGEEGEMHDPDRTEEEARPHMAEIREGELRRAVAVLDVTALELLGYRDSGMIGTPANEHPDNFHNADPEEAIGRLVRLIRRHRPQVLVTYNEDGGYGHPDHLQCHRVTVAAFDAAGDVARFPDAGSAWTVGKLYAIAWSREAWRALRDEMQARGLKWPNRDEEEKAPEVEAGEVAQAVVAEHQEPAVEEEEWGQPEATITAFIETGAYNTQVMDALREHRTQPVGFFLDLPADLAAMRTSEYFVLLKSHVASERPEHDLFAGLRAPGA